MKIFKHNGLMLFLLLFSIYTNANNITFTPVTQDITVNSGEEIEATIRLNCYGSAPGASSFFIAPNQIPDNGYINLSPGTGAMFPGDVTNVTFRFKRTVSATTTSNYIFRQEWVDEEGNSNSGSLYINVTYVNNSPPTCNLSSPSNRTTTNITTNSAEVNWNSVSGNSGYQSQYRRSDTSSWTTISSSSTNTSQSISNLQSNTDYVWRVRTRCNDATYGDWSSSTSFTTLESTCSQLGILTNLVSFNITHSSATISWDREENHYRYQVRFSHNSYVHTLSKNEETYSSFAPSTTYTWQVRNKCSNGEYGDWSEEQQFTTKPYIENDCYTAIPFNGSDGSGTIRDDYITSNSFRLRWVNIPNNHGYVLQYKVHGPYSWSTDINLPINSTEHTISNLTPNTIYDVRIAPKCSDGTIGEWQQDWYERWQRVTTKNLCPNDIIINNSDRPDRFFTSYSVFIHKALNNITSNSHINPLYNNSQADAYRVYPTQTKLLAGNKIKLQVGFKVQNGDLFTAKIQECSSSTTSKNNSKKQTVEIQINRKEESIQLYPNPTSGIVNISGTENIVSWEVYNSVGATYNKSNSSAKQSETFSVNLSDYPSGLYFIRITLKNGEQLIKKIIKE